MHIASIVLGAVSLLAAFAPHLALQVLGAVLGGAGIVMARRAKRADYRLDMPANVGFIMSVVGVVLCLVGPVIWLMSVAVLTFA